MIDIGHLVDPVLELGWRNFSKMLFPTILSQYNAKTVTFAEETTACLIYCIMRQNFSEIDIQKEIICATLFVKRPRDPRVQLSLNIKRRH